MTRTPLLADLERAFDLLNQVDESKLDFAPDPECLSRHSRANGSGDVSSRFPPGELAGQNRGRRKSRG